MKYYTAEKKDKHLWMVGDSREHKGWEKKVSEQRTHCYEIIYVKF